jgi:hypothetical protein
MDQRLQIVRRNQEIIHSQRDEPLQEFPDVPIFPPIPDPYGSLTPAELAAFGIGPPHVSSDNDDEAQTDDDEETEDDEKPASLHSSFSFFGVLTTKGKKSVISIRVFHSMWLVIWTRICLICGS